MKKRINVLEQAAAYMQQAQAANQANGGAANNDAPAGSNPDDVVDADFTNKNN